MAAKTPTITYRSEYTRTVEVKKKEIGFSVSSASTGDTITISDVTTLASAHLYKKSDGTEVACSIATNVITVGGSVSSVDLGGIAVES